MKDNKSTFQPDKSQNISSILQRRKMKIIGVFLILFSISALIIQKIPNQYKASAQISFNGKDERFIETQKYNIKSLLLARQVASALNLLPVSDIEINIPSKELSSDKFKTLNITYNNKPQQPISQKEAALLQKIIKPLSIYNPDNSNILQLSYVSNSPRKAEEILGSFIKHYIKDIKNKTVQSQQYIYNHGKWSNELQETLKKLQNNLNNAIYLADSLKKQNHQPKIPINNNLKVQKIALENIINNPKTDNHVISLIYLLKNKENEYNKLSLRYGEKHPKIKAIKSEISKVKHDIEHYKEQAIKQAKTDLERINAKITLAKKIDENAQIYNNSNNKNKHDIIIKANAEINNILYKLQNGTYLLTKRHLQNNDIQIISPAVAIERPISPDRTKLTLISFIFSLFTAFIFVVIIEKINKTFLTGKQLETALKQPCYSLLPKLENNKDKIIANYVIDNPTSDIAEAVRNLRLNIKLNTHTKSKNTQVVMLTSSKSNEGKTTLSTWLGHLSAKSGEKVVIIDADLRQPRLHKALGTENTLSLVDYLTGSDKLENIIDKDFSSGLHAIYGRSVPANALDLICSHKMADLIKNLKKDYDLIIIDTPACMAIPDARAVQRYCDLLLYIVAWNKTHREVIHNGISQFINSETSDIATVLSNIDVKKHVQYGYGDVISDYGIYKPV